MFKAIFVYTLSLRLAWATCDPSFKQQNPKTTKKPSQAWCGKPVIPVLVKLRQESINSQVALATQEDPVTNNNNYFRTKIGMGRWLSQYSLHKHVDLSPISSFCVNIHLWSILQSQQRKMGPWCSLSTSPICLVSSRPAREPV